MQSLHTGDGQLDEIRVKMLENDSTQGPRGLPLKSSGSEAHCFFCPYPAVANWGKGVTEPAETTHLSAVAENPEGRDGRLKC